jgi:hypothetical protein
MARNAFQPALFNPLMLWAEIGMKTTEMLLASGQVIGTRVGQMARHGANPSASERREMLLMGSEKMKAATQSGMAVATRLQAYQWQLMTRGWQQPWLGSFAALSTEGARLAGAALKPVHGASTANARRLSRSRSKAR